MEKRVISTERAPAAIGLYSQAVAAGGFLFVSGQIPLDPASGEVVEGGFPSQAQRVLDNFLAVIEAAGLKPEHVVRTTVYLTDLSRFQEFNALYAERFGSSLPARAVVQVSALPRGVEIEMDGMAVFPAES